MADRTVLVRLRADSDQFVREMAKAGLAVAAVRDNINTTNDRTAWLSQSILALGPAAVSAGAVAVPALVGMATQAGVLGGAITGVILAFQGVGDGLKALNEYQLDPTTENLAELDAQLEKIGRHGADMVRALDQAGDTLSVLSRDARRGAFPGMIEGLDYMLTRLPEVRQIIGELSTTVGGLSSNAGQSLASDEWQDFFNYLANDGSLLLAEMSTAFGNFIDGFASMIVAFGPLTRGFSAGLLDMSQGFEQWAEGLAGTQGFQEFSTYIRDNGPKVLDTLGALTMALVDIGEAAAPVGEIMVPALKLFAEAISLIADTPLGPLLITTAAITSLYGRIGALRELVGSGTIGKALSAFGGNIKTAGAGAAAAAQGYRSFGTAAAFALYNQRTLTHTVENYSGAAARSAQKALDAKNAVREFGRAVGPAAAQVGLMAVAVSGVSEDLGLSNTAMLAMVGSLTGPWGAAMGAAAGLVLDVKDSLDDASDAQERYDAALRSDNQQQINAALQENVDLLNEMRDRANITGFGDFFDDLAHGFDAASFERRGLRGFGGESWDEAITRVEGRGDQLEKALDQAAAEAGRAERWQQAQQQIQTFATSASESFDDLTDALDDNEVSFEKWLRKLGQQAEAAARQSENITAALQLGIDPEALQRLLDEGQAGALRLDQLVQGGPEAVRKFNRIMRKFRNNLDGLDRHAQDVGARVLGALAGEGVDIQPFVDKLKTAKAAFDELPKEVRAKVRADGIPQTKRQIDDLVDELDLTEKERQALVTLRDNGIFGTIQAIRSALNDITGTYTATVRVATVGAGALPDKPLPLVPGGGAADGMTVPGRRLPYGDKMIAAVAPGEEIITNRHGEADRFRADRAAGRIPAYADGGTVGTHAATPRGPSVDRILALAAAGRFAELDRLNPTIKRLEKAIQRTTKELEKEREARRQVRDQMRQTAATVRGRLRSDLWDTETDPWSSDYAGGSYGDVMSTLREDTRAGWQFRNAVRELKQKGLHGAALREVIENGDPVAFQDLTRKQLAAFQTAYQKRQKATAAAGAISAESVYGDKFDAVVKSVNGVKAEVKGLKQTLKEEHREDRRARKNGASSAVRGKG